MLFALNGFRPSQPPRTRPLKLRLTDAWLAESKDGLVQMLREDRPFVDQSLATFAMITSNAPPMPSSNGWWRGRYTLRSSFPIAAALGELGDESQGLLKGVPVSISTSGAPFANDDDNFLQLLTDDDIEMEMNLKCGIGLRLTGSLRHRTMRQPS